MTTPVAFYTGNELITLTQYFQRISLNNLMTDIELLNDDITADIYWSWDGVNLAGNLFPKESVVFNSISTNSIYLKTTANGSRFRLIASQ